MIVANIQLSKTEDHSIHSSKYGAGAVFSKYARILRNDESNIFYDFAPRECFENIKSDEKPEKCIALSERQLQDLRQFKPIKNIIPESKDVDVFVFNNDDLIVDTEGIKATQVLWHAFTKQTCHPYIPNLFIYSKDQNPIVYQNTNVFKVKIGKPVQENFQPTIKEDFLFQCTRNDATMDSIYTAKLCQRYDIKGYFGGPILDNYPLFDYIDNKNTFYLGVLPEQKKLDWARRARLYGCVQNWDTIFNLSAVEALGQGTPIICRNRGCFKYLIQDKIDGFFYDDNEESFLKIWEESKNINQINCYNKALQYSEKEMVNSFYSAFEEILKK
jgi:hypothetical protein